MLALLSTRLKANNDMRGNHQDKWLLWLEVVFQEASRSSQSHIKCTLVHFSVRIIRVLRSWKALAGTVFYRAVRKLIM